MKIFFFLFLVSFNTHAIFLSRCYTKEIKDLTKNFKKSELEAACNLRPGDETSVCNGEACGILTYPKAIADVKLHERPDLKSPIIGEIKKCDLIKNFNHLSVFKKHGVVVALSDMPGYGLKKGDSLNFAFASEGNFYGCINKRPVVFYATNTDDEKKACFKIKSSSEMEYWVHHSASNGESGYSKVVGESFFIPYGGFEKSKVCPEDLHKFK